MCIEPANKMSECGICIDTYTKSTRKKVVCPSCDYECCTACMKQFVLSQTTHDAHCMNCKVAFTNEFLDITFTKKWNTQDYQNHRNNILFNQEKSYLAETEDYARAVNDANDLVSLANDYEGKILNIEKAHSDRTQHMNDSVKNLQEQIDKINKELKIENDKMLEVKRPLSLTIKNLYRKATKLMTSDEHKVKEKRKFVMNCCVSECKGFINNKYSCGICDTKMCSKCHKEEVEGHVCNEDDIKTVDEIKRTCKACPKCGIPTHRISGCPQMWCVGCHSVWDWNTGMMDTSGVIHNPHYYQFLRNDNGVNNAIRREDGDVLCGGDVTGVELRYAFAVHATESTAMKNIGMMVIENTNHISEHVMNKYRAADRNYLRQYRVLYLHGKLTDEQWKVKLQMYEKKERKKRQYREVLGLYCASMQDLLRNSVELHTLQIREMIQMKDYTNGVLYKLNKHYGNVGTVLPYKTLVTSPYAQRMGIIKV